MDKLPQTPDTYDRMFANGGYGGAFQLPYRHSWYFPMYRGVFKAVKSAGSKHVLEVGCGTGGFAHLLFEHSNIDYVGFDFSPEAVSQARARTARDESFFVGDATVPETYARDYDTIVCTEVLEHIEADRTAVSLWKRGATCICSVPNFDSTVHVRFFRHEDEVRERYGDLIDIASIVRIRKPWLPDISLRNRLRHLIWNRYQPRRLAYVMGLTSFDKGGWFVFTGTRR